MMTIYATFIFPVVFTRGSPQITFLTVSLVRNRNVTKDIIPLGFEKKLRGN